MFGSDLATAGPLDDANALPAYDEDGRLPAEIRGPGGELARQSPYGCDMEMFRKRFGGVEARDRLIDGLEAYRSDMEATGLLVAMQWIGGDIVTRDGEPTTVQLVNFCLPPRSVTTVAELEDFSKRHATLMSRIPASKRYGCDPTFVLMTANPINMVRASAHASVRLTHDGHGHAQGYVALAGFGDWSAKKIGPSSGRSSSPLRRQ